MVRLCAVFGTGRGVVDQPFDHLVGRVVGRAVWREEERDGSDGGLMKERRQSLECIGRQADHRTHLFQVVELEILAVDWTGSLDAALRKHIYVVYLRMSMRFLSTWSV